MDYIRKLPLLFALLGAIITGLWGHARQLSNKDLLIKMIIAMVIFYVAGFVAKGTLSDIVEAYKKKEEEKAAMAIQEEQKDKAAPEKKPETTGKTINLAADEKINLDVKEDDFDALPVAEFIKKELKN